jgi:tripartite-type tricarboxylate transporter receptor subunit TctC
MIKRQMTIAALVLGAMLAGIEGSAGQAAWPDRPIRMIVPFPAGSTTDVIGRIIGNKLGPRLGQQVVVENRVGASGTIGMDAVAKAAPDGYTIGYATASTHALAPILQAQLPYDPIRDFKPVIVVGSAPYALVIHPGLMAKTLSELIALAKSQPGKLNYGSAGPASLAHLAGELFAAQAGVHIVHVPYKSSAQSVIDLISGRLDMQFATIIPTLPNIRAGKLRVLATTGKQRVAALPEVPTVAETGIAGYEAVLWTAFVMPPGTADAIVARLNREVTEILNEADTRDLLVKQGTQPEPGPPEALTARIRADMEKWRAVIAKAGILSK